MIFHFSNHYYLNKKHHVSAKLFSKAAASILFLAIPFSSLSAETLSDNNGFNETKKVSIPQSQQSQSQAANSESIQQQQNQLYIKINPKKLSPFNNGIWQGFGTSLCWWANRLGYSEELSEECAKLFYTKDGLNLNIARYNIGGGDNPKHTHITRTDSAMEGFLVKNENGKFDYDWNRDKNQRNVLEKVIKASDQNLILEAFSNSPPYFMTYSGCTSGAVIGTMNNLKAWKYDDFAEYIATVINHFKEQGIKFQSVSAMNEPTNIYWWAKSFKQEGCHYGYGHSHSKMITQLEKSLSSKNLNDIIITGTDETSIKAQTKAIKKLSKKAINAVQRIDTHTYWGNENDRIALQKQAEKSGKNLWMSEVDGDGCIGKDEGSGEMACPLWFSLRIIKDMNLLKSSAWVIWQIIDSHISKDGYMGRTDSGMPDLHGGYWGCAFADHDAKKIILSQKYYAYGQFSKFIRPGMKIIYSSESETLEKPAEKSVTAYDETSKTLTIVAVNDTANEKPLFIDLTAFKNPGSKCQLFRTSGSITSGEHWHALPELSVNSVSRSLSDQMPPFSITTYVISGVQK